ncbi:CdaR family protein [Alkalicoccus urumqiensis]|uniref:YbbR-like domain-containing protein n=1 Tax=Alkalicoccus urumqiensis TaxID=1548213 RepID=A0A2P6MLM6_ALKUR|nr:CdaR family protein [Alkalicoccus urumqiensis]PRO67158.1 YbbR-like domain-containing protein [Alkalicoccus urumqiensis]
MDKLFNKSWFIKLASIVIAVLLFLMVNIENQQMNQAGGIPGVTEGERVLEEVPLNIYYDEERFVLTDAPETVQVFLRGPQNVLTYSQVTQTQQEVFIDLRGREAGVHYERIQHSGFPNDVRVSIVPLTVDVTLQERMTSSVPVEVNLENEEDLAEGYMTGEPETEPSTVDITAAEGVLDQIAGASVNVDVSGREETFTESVEVVVYDSSGNALEAETNPPAVDVTVPITSPNKEVPLRIGRTGDPPEGTAISSITLEPPAVQVFGPVTELNELSVIDLEDVDLSELDGDTSYETTVPVPEGMEQVEPEEVTVNVDTTGEEEREYSGFPVTVTGVASGLDVEFPALVNGEIDLQIQAGQSVLDRVSRSDFEAVLDLTDYGAGAYNVPLEIRGPQDVRFPQQGMEVSVVLLNGEALNEPETEDTGDNDVQTNDTNDTNETNEASSENIDEEPAEESQENEDSEEE